MFPLRMRSLCSMGGLRHFGTVPKRKVQRKRSFKDEINNYFTKSELFQVHKNLLSSRLIERKRTTNQNALYLMEPEIADKIGECLEQNVDLTGKVVFEANPGLGLLTERLLRTNLKKLNVFESDSYFRSIFKSIVDGNPERLKLVPINIFLLWKATYQDRIDNGSRVAKIMEDVEKRAWEDDPAFTLIGALPGISFYRHILSSIIFQTGIVPYGRPEMFILLNTQTYVQIKYAMAVKQVLYKADTVFFHLFFDSELLLRVNAKGFLPWQILKSRPDPLPAFETLGFSPDELYLVRLCPNKDLYKVVPKELLKPFWYFLKHMMNSRKNRVIPLMEKWVPGCGRNLLRRGIGVFTEVGDLSPQEFLDLFLEFTKWPEFQTCPFLPAMESILLKMENHGNDDILEEDDVHRED